MPPSEHELRLRERLSRLRNTPLLGGTKISGGSTGFSANRPHRAKPTDEDIWRSASRPRHDERPYTLDYVSCSTTGSSSTATAAELTTAPWSRGSAS
jgi:hypothetical protein